MAFCTKCGASIEGQFCTNCGTPIGVAGASGPPPETPGSMPPPIPQSPPAPVNIALKKHGPLLWILLGCLGVIVIAGVIAVSCGLFVINKARQAGIDPAMMEKNPGLAVAKMLATMNPDIEVLSVDESRGIIRVRDKKTGKSLTMNLAEAKNGKIVFQDDDNKNLEIQTQGEGDSASIQMRSPEGTVRMGAGAVQLPDWMPAYPGATGTGSFGVNANNGKAGTDTFETSDSVEEVASFYEKALKDGGFEVQKTTMQAPNQESMVILSGDARALKRTASATIASKEGKTVVSLMFEQK
jgi:hypothetical protein